MKAYIGIDIGSAGAIVVLPESGSPEILRFINSTEKQILDFVQDITFKYEQISCIIELVGAMPGQGVSSMFSFGNSAGFIRGIITACGISFQQKVPRTWQKSLGITPRFIEKNPITKKVLNEESKTDFKRRVRQKAEQLYPAVKMTNDIADALLIAHYCKITQNV